MTHKTATEFFLIQAEWARRKEPEWRAFGVAYRALQEAIAKRIGELASNPGETFDGGKDG